MELTRFARPYAQAAFEYALEHKQLPSWSKALHKLAEIAQAPEMRVVLKNPQYTSEQLQEICVDLAKDVLDASLKNFVKLLAENHRLIALPQIFHLFEKYRAAAEKRLDVTVNSAIQLEDDFQQELKDILSERFKRDVILHCDVQPELIAGLLIRAGDIVIDSSVRGQLERLRESLLR